MAQHVFNLADIYQKAENIKSSRLTNRIDKIRLNDLQATQGLKAQRRDILASGFGPEGTYNRQKVEQGLGQAGDYEGLIDFQKVQNTIEKGRAELEQSNVTLKGTKLDNANKRADMTGRGATTVLKALEKYTQDGLEINAATVKTQGVFNLVKRKLEENGIDTTEFGDSANIEQLLAISQLSKDTRDYLGQQEARAGVERGRQATEKERGLKRAEAKVKNRGSAQKRLSNIEIAKANLLTRTPMDAGMAELFPDAVKAMAGGPDQIKKAIKALETEAGHLRKRWNISTLDDIFGGK